MDVKEIGGYLEFEEFAGEMLHEEALHLNYGRACIEYVIKARKISRLRIPYYLPPSVDELLHRMGVNVEYYAINDDFKLPNLLITEGEWILVVNYFGQLSNEYLTTIAKRYNNRIIIDNTQSYFQSPIEGVDTFYNCRKYFGVPDGAVLYTDMFLNQELERDNSYLRFKHLIGRFEIGAEKLYKEYKENEQALSSKPLMKMSRLTSNLLHAVDYEHVMATRKNNFKYLHQFLFKKNELKLDWEIGTFMYPYMIENAENIRKRLIDHRIYIPILWPNILKHITNSPECRFVNNILPLPIDQRYSNSDMQRIINVINGEL